MTELKAHLTTDPTVLTRIAYEAAEPEPIPGLSEVSRTRLHADGYTIDWKDEAGGHGSFFLPTGASTETLAGELESDARQLIRRAARIRLAGALLLEADAQRAQATAKRRTEAGRKAARTRARKKDPFGVHASSTTPKSKPHD